MTRFYHGFWAKKYYYSYCQGQDNTKECVEVWTCFKYFAFFRKSGSKKSTSQHGFSAISHFQRIFNEWMPFYDWS